MKSRSLILPALILAVASVSAADTSTNQPAICGGYSESAIDAEAKAAAVFAVEAEAKTTGRRLRLVEVDKVERQVVAGLNYRLELTVEDGGKTIHVQTVVWQKLDGTFSLTSWVWSSK